MSNNTSIVVLALIGAVVYLVPKILRWLESGKTEQDESQDTPKHSCTYCGEVDFIEGPSGGLSTNVLCANLDCRHWFNHTPFGLDDLHRTESRENMETNDE